MNIVRIGSVEFPSPRSISVNMMPFVFGEKSSLPESLHGYLPLIQLADYAYGKTAYLTINESFVEAGDTQRRPGIHTDGTRLLAFGGGGWGGGWGGSTPPPPIKKRASTGIYMASSDGRCRAWDCLTYEVDEHGGATRPDSPEIVMEPSTLYWLTDRTPHESLPALKSSYRQFFRLVSSEVDVWWAQHSTANPLGVQPNCHIEYGSKFQ